LILFNIFATDISTLTPPSISDCRQTTTNVHLR